MKVLWYCPKCNREEIKDVFPNRDERTWTNLRDGYGTPICHYKCECGNPNAGAMHFKVVGDITDYNIEYFKSVIEMYQ